MTWDELKDVTFSVVDLETSGLSPQRDEILEISIVKISNRQMLSTWESLVRPRGRVSLTLTEIHGIDNDMLMTAPSRTTVIPKVQQMLKGTTLVEHNQHNFDSSFLLNFVKQQTWTSQVNTLQLARFLIPKLKRYDLETLCKLHSISLPHHHTAKEDANATAQLLIRLIDKAVAELLPVEDLRSILGIPRRE